MITADQLVCHAIGDYVLQSDWMALEKTSKSKACVAHVLTYALPFLLLTRNPTALAVIVGTHFVIDRWRLARYVVWTKNQLGTREYRHPWSECSGTGYHQSRPPFMAVWLMIIVDNLLHVIINGLALRWFP